MQKNQDLTISIVAGIYSSLLFLEDQMIRSPNFQNAAAIIPQFTAKTGMDRFGMRRVVPATKRPMSFELTLQKKTGERNLLRRQPGNLHSLNNLCLVTLHRNKGMKFKKENEFAGSHKDLRYWKHSAVLG